MPINLPNQRTMVDDSGTSTVSTTPSKSGSNVIYRRNGKGVRTTSSKYERKYKIFPIKAPSSSIKVSSDVPANSIEEARAKYYKGMPLDPEEKVTKGDDGKEIITPTPESEYMKNPNKIYEDVNILDYNSDVIDMLNSTTGYLTSKVPTPHVAAVNKSIEYYNRYKVVNPDELLQRGFGHVFFVKPSCSIFVDGTTKMRQQFQRNPDFLYTYRNYPNVVKELSTDTACGYHDFSFLLSNHVTSFSLNDDKLEHGTYGQGWSGYKMAYGRHDLQSKAADTISLEFSDTRDLAVYQMLRLWEKYISGVYRGTFTPYFKYIKNKILDYAGSIYYIITAEDGESIIYWAKYYGVFPIEVPATGFAWNKGTIFNSSELKYNIEFAYSFKENYNFSTLYEFNYNSRLDNITGQSNKSFKYAPTYVDELGSAGRFWVGRPFIDFVKDGDRMDCKLRFVDDPALDKKSQSYYKRSDVIK